jgi:hypothetical protein
MARDGEQKFFNKIKRAGISRNDLARQQRITKPLISRACYPLANLVFPQNKSEIM